MTIEEIISRPVEFQWRMLGRLESDLDSGCRLWGGTMEYHTEVYRAICKSLGVTRRTSQAAMPTE